MSSPNLQKRTALFKDLCSILLASWCYDSARIGKEAFLCCISLRELVIPTELRYLGIRAFCGCEQLALFTLLDIGDVERTTQDIGDVERTIQAENNAFLMCDNFARASWIELLSPRDPDSDAFDEELHTELP